MGVRRAKQGTIAAWGIMFGIGVAGVLWGLQQHAVATRLAAVQTAAASAAEDQHEPKIVEITRLVRTLKIVTVEIETSVTSATHHDSWRGDVAASVRAPVRYFYGTDLGDPAATVRRDALTGVYVFRLPPPRRLATQVYTGQEQSDVDVGWGRLRDRAGEYYLGLARVGLADEAARAPLSSKDAAEVERLTREQLENLVRVIAGDEAVVDVRFDPALAERRAKQAGVETDER